MLYETEELPKTHDEYVKTSSSQRIEQQETVIIWFLSIVSQFPETADHDTGNHGQPGSECSHRTQTVICQCPSSQKLQTMILEIMVNLVLSAHVEHKQSSVSVPVTRNCRP